MVIKKVPIGHGPQVVDVFFGIGWTNWSRLQKQSPDSWKLIKGRPMPLKVHEEFMNRMNRKPAVALAAVTPEK